MSDADKNLQITFRHMCHSFYGSFTGLESTFADNKHCNWYMWKLKSIFIQFFFQTDISN